MCVFDMYNHTTIIQYWSRMGIKSFNNNSMYYRSVVLWLFSCTFHTFHVKTRLVLIINNYFLCYKYSNGTPGRVVKFKMNFIYRIKLFTTVVLIEHIL